MSTISSRNTAWSIRLGAAPVVVLLGVMSSTLILSFFSGFHFGRKVGFEIARETTLSTSPLLPIVSDEEVAQSDSGNDKVTEIYAKLNEPATLSAEINKLPAEKDQADLEVQGIHSTEDMPLDAVVDLKISALEEKAEQKPEKLLATAKENVLPKDTLGNLKRELTPKKLDSKKLENYKQALFSRLL